MEHKTITFKEQLSFDAALQALLEGKCIGIRPDGGNNSDYVVLYRPKWQMSDYQLCWSKQNGGGIRTNQFRGTWCLVVIDHLQFATIES